MRRAARCSRSRGSGSVRGSERAAAGLRACVRAGRVMRRTACRSSSRSVLPRRRTARRSPCSTKPVPASPAVGRPNRQERRRILAARRERDAREVRVDRWPRDTAACIETFHRQRLGAGARPAVHRRRSQREHASGTSPAPRRTGLSARLQPSTCFRCVGPSVSSCENLRHHVYRPVDLPHTSFNTLGIQFDGFSRHYPQHENQSGPASIRRSPRLHLMPTFENNMHYYGANP